MYMYRIMTPKRKNTPDKQLTKELWSKIDMVSATMIEINKEVDKIDDIQKKVRKISALEQGINQVLEDLKTVNNRMDSLENRILKLEKEEGSTLHETLLMELRQKERFLRFRSLQETEEEDIKLKIIQLRAECMGKPGSEIHSEVDEVFRINSEIARERKLTRDVLVGFVKKSFRNEILHKRYQDRMKAKRTKFPEPGGIKEFSKKYKKDLY
uniref:Uncharacterized protein n=1 Tax=Sphaerodactylus townsendi TaxID=933632 RepID=A0ACB8EQ75_9SAUR